jgi:hypothetical protein
MFFKVAALIFILRHLPETDDEDTQALEGPFPTRHKDIFKVKWRVKNFFSSKDQLHSPTFQIAGVNWRVLLHTKVLFAMFQCTWMLAFHSHLRTMLPAYKANLMINLISLLSPQGRNVTSALEHWIGIFLERDSERNSTVSLTELSKFLAKAIHV